MDQIEKPSRGSFALTLHAFYHTLRISVPTVFEAAIGTLTQKTCDARLRDWADSLVRITRTTHTTAGLEHIPNEPCIVMSNHLSLCDVPLIYASLPTEISLRMIAKAELFKVPIWGRAMRASGFIPIVRSDREKAIGSLNDAGESIRKGTYIWIAPEGTRSRSGELGPLKKGGFILAEQTGLPILPVCIRGSQRILPPTGLLTHRGHAAHVEFRALIKTKGLSIPEMMDAVRAQIDPKKPAA